MSPKETKTDGKYNINMGWILFVPIILLLGIVPLVTRLEIIDLDPDTYRIFGREQMFDFFSQNKAALIIGLAAISLFILFLAFDKSKMKLKKEGMMYYIFITIFLGFSLISTFTSEYRQIAIWGIADRSEGMLVIASYLAIMIYSIYIFNSAKDYRYILYPLVFLILVTGILGFYQYTGKDLLLQTDWGKKLIIPEVYGELRESVTSQYESGRIYGTMYHYNYMGSFTAMMIPLFLTLTVFIKGYKKKIGLGIVTLLSVMLLFGSTSRAGIIGLGLSLVVFVILFSRRMLKHYKALIVIAVVGILAMVGVNTVTQGVIFERIPDMLKDAVALLGGGDSTFDYKDHIPVRDIRTEGNMIIVELQEDSLKVQQSEEGLVFTDASNAPVEFYFEEKAYYTKDSRFKDLAFNKQIVGSTGKEYVVIAYGGESVAVGEVNTPEGAYLVNRTTLEKEAIAYPETIGFEGKEKIGSARGYIWSRSLPLLKETWLIGNGPDTYAIKFPQADIFGKWYAYDTPNMIVDKPHNLYLQIGINQGGIALIGFLGLMLTYIIQSFRIYAFRKTYDTLEIVGSSILVAIVGYLGAGIFNDSIVSVAPIFWILLGVGIATNFLIIREKRRVKALLEHATIDINTQKHI